MIRRFALVVWWIGALFAFAAALCAAGGVVGGLVHQRDDFIAALIGSFFVVPALACWATAFVMAGSFWKPPRH